jgi:hypothetical protein
MPKGIPGRPICRIDGCNLPNEARGLCNTHYKRWQYIQKGECKTPLEAPIATNKSGASILSIKDAKALLYRISVGMKLTEACKYFKISVNVVHLKRQQCPAFDLAVIVALSSARIRRVREHQNAELRGRAESLRIEMQRLMDDCMRDWYRGDFRW